MNTVAQYIADNIYTVITAVAVAPLVILAAVQAHRGLTK